LRIVRSDVFGFLDRPVAAPEFDVIFADPPYVKAWRDNDLPSPAELMEAILKSGLLAPGGFLVLEQGAKEDLPQVEGWELIRDKRYGAAQLRFFRLG
jgi:16S rRNA G966 N2-methylase RsmD